MERTSKRQEGFRLSKSESSKQMEQMMNEMKRRNEEAKNKANEALSK